MANEISIFPLFTRDQAFPPDTVPTVRSDAGDLREVGPGNIELAATPDLATLLEAPNIADSDPAETIAEEGAPDIDVD